MKRSLEPQEKNGAESPRNVGMFVFGLMVLLVFAFGIVLLVFHHHAPVPQTEGGSHSSRSSFPPLFRAKAVLSV